MKAAIWARVSTDAQEDGTSLDHQLAEDRRLCEAEGFDVAAAYRVVHSIAYLEDIPEWQRLRQQIIRREIGALVVWKFERISGQTADLLGVYRDCKRYGVAFWSVLEGKAPDDEAGFLSMFIQAFFTQKRREGILKATGDGQKNKMRGINGKKPRPLGCQWVPFGLRWVEEYETRGGLRYPMKRSFEADPGTIEWLRAIFRWYDEGQSLRGICKRLETSGVTSHTGKAHWAASTLRKVLRNENYVGVGYAGTTDRRNGAKGKVKPREEWIRLPDGTFPKVVDEALFARVNERLARERTRYHECAPGNRNPEVALLRRGIGVCGYCGRSLNVALNHGRPYYRCAPENRDRLGCPSYGMLAEALDEQVWAFVLALFKRKGALEAKLFGDEQPDPTTATLPQAEARLAKLEKDRAKLRRMIAQEEDETLAGEWREELKVTVAEVRAEQARHQAIVAERGAWRVAQERRQAVLDEADRLRDQLDGLDWRGRRNVLIRIGARVKLYKEEDCDPRWCVTTRFVVGNAVSLGVAGDVPAAETADDWVLRDHPTAGDEIGGEEVNVYMRSAPAPSPARSSRSL